MATSEFTQRAPAGLGERLRLALETALARLVTAWRASRNRRSVARLLEWDAHMLRDIGLTPGDVRSALSAPLADDPSYRLGMMSLERRKAFQASAKERLDLQGELLRSSVSRNPRPRIPQRGRDRRTA